MSVEFSPCQRVASPSSQIQPLADMLESEE